MARLPSRSAFLVSVELRSNLVRLLHRSSCILQSGQPLIPISDVTPHNQYRNKKCHAETFELAMRKEEVAAVMLCWTMVGYVLTSSATAHCADVRCCSKCLCSGLIAALSRRIRSTSNHAESFLAADCPRGAIISVPPLTGYVGGQSLEGWRLDRAPGQLAVKPCCSR